MRGCRPAVVLESFQSNHYLHFDPSGDLRRSRLLEALHSSYLSASSPTLHLDHPFRTLITLRNPRSFFMIPSATLSRYPLPPMCFTVNASAWARYSVRGPPPTPADKRILEAEGHVIVAMGKPLLADALLNPMSADKKSTGILKRVVLLERVGKTRGKRNTCLTEGGPDRPSYRLAINNDGGQSRKPLLQALKHSLSIPLNFEVAQSLTSI